MGIEFNSKRSLSGITFPDKELHDLITQTDENTNKTIINPTAYGAIADGLSHKIIDELPNVTLDEVQALNSSATLEDEVDWYAIQKCLSLLESNRGGTVQLEAKTYVISKPIIISGFAINDGWDNGGIVLKGLSSRGSIIKATFTGSAIKRTQSMFNSIENLSIFGKGKSDTGSIGIELIGTGGNNFFKNVYVHDFEKGITTYDITLISCTNVAIRNCSRGIEGQYNCDIFTFVECRFDYCDNAIYIGQPSVSHPSGSQEENCWKFIGCRISNNTDNAILIDDYGASNISFDSCYFEGNTKEGRLGNTSTVNPDSTLISFENCYWTAYPATIQGYYIPGNSIICFKNCKVDGSSASPYNPFISMAHGAGNLSIDRIKTNYVTNIVNFSGRSYYYNPVNGSKLLMNLKTYGKYALDNVPEIDSPLDFTITGATGKKFLSIKKASSSTEATISELWIKDVSGVVELGGTGVYNKMPISSGTTANRPTDKEAGFQYFDTTLGKPIWLKTIPSTWVDATGTTV